jgi:hypothetical protein
MRREKRILRDFLGNIAAAGEHKQRPNESCVLGPVNRIE